MGGCYEDGGAVMNCDKPKMWVKHENAWRENDYGIQSTRKYPEPKYRYQALCNECGATGAFQRTCPVEVTVDPEFAKTYKRRKEEEREEDRERREQEKQKLVKNKQGEWRDNYNKYLQSKEWELARQKVLKRDKYTCQGCLTAKATEVHHFSYEHAGNELLWDLVSVCRRCHAKYHDKEVGPYEKFMEQLEWKAREEAAMEKPLTHKHFSPIGTPIPGVPTFKPKIVISDDELPY